MKKIIIFFAILLHFVSATDVCPKSIICVSSEEENSCPPGQFYREKVKVYGCCPGCVTLKAENEVCTFPAECEPGLTCTSANKCEKDPSQGCEFYKRFDPLLSKTKYWNPVCLPDGSYAFKQCKGEKMTGKCFCVNRLGLRIFGETEWAKAGNMTCACSRLVEDLKTKNSESTFHCDNLGNFEPLQCDKKTCWCANPRTGIPYTLMVPLEMMISLPCYNRDSVGAQYYRQCDSANRMKEVVESLLKNHGTTGINFASAKCNPDGSFHRVQVFREKKRCVYLNNSPITEAVESKDANCNCAYDRHVAQLNQIEFFSDCLPNGNYKRKQIWDEKVYCIDDDGFYYSDDPDDCPA